MATPYAPPHCTQHRTHWMRHGLVLFTALTLCTACIGQGNAGQHAPANQQTASADTASATALAQISATQMARATQITAVQTALAVEAQTPEIELTLEPPSATIQDAISDTFDCQSLQPAGTHAGDIVELLYSAPHDTQPALLRARLARPLSEIPQMGGSFRAMLITNPDTDPHLLLYEIKDGFVKAGEADLPTPGQPIIPGTEATVRTAGADQILYRLPANTTTIGLQVFYIAQANTPRLCDSVPNRDQAEFLPLPVNH